MGLKVQVAVAGGTVYIRADGSVDPPTVPIQRTQDAYTFYGDVNASLVLQRDNIVVDGAGHLLKGEGGGTGVDLTGRTNVTVEKLGITMFRNGVYLSFSYNDTLSGNNITANTDYGIQSDFWNPCSGNVIVNNNMTGNGGTGNGGGILLNPASSYTSMIDNYVAENNQDGIRLYATAHDLLSGNKVTANDGFGVYLDSWNTTLRNNSMNQNRRNFGVEAYFLDVFVSDDIDASNTVDGRPVYYWMNKHGVTVPSDAGYVALINSSDVTVRGLNLTNNGQGILLFNTENCTVTENNMTNNWMGFWINGEYATASSKNNSITYNNITGSDIFTIENSVFDTLSYNIIQNDAETTHYLDVSGGTSNIVIRYNNVTNSYIDLSGSPNSDVSHNNIVGGGLSFDGTSNATICYNNVSSSPTDGIDMDSSSNNVISQNDIEANRYNGVYLSYSSSGNNITNNRIANNNVDGLELVFSSDSNVVSDNEFTGNGFNGVFLVFDSANNVFSHNKFVNNTSSAGTSFAATNIWDSGYPAGGNYWSDYTGTDTHSGPFQNETGSDGLGDTAYVVYPNNMDHYPLMKPYAGPHDLGVKASVSKTVVPEGYNRTVSMNVTIINHGVQTETFNFTCQIGSTIQEQTVTLMQRNSTLFTFSFNVAGWSKGNYTLCAQVSQVPGETDTADNSYERLFIVSILGDINGDGKCDIRDLSYVAKRFGTTPSSSMWDPNADVTGPAGAPDGKIDIRDLHLVAVHFGDHYP